MCERIYVTSIFNIFKYTNVLLDTSLYNVNK